MHYTDIENQVVDKGTEYEETIINWRTRRRRVQLKCPRCFHFFDLPKDITIDDNGYCSTSVYHFCEDQYEGDENNEGYTVLAHLVGWGL
jgi:hypothetical protein